jgi:TrbL/VirB6 plasmid conjugal transfer protein
VSSRLLRITGVCTVLALGFLLLVTVAAAQGVSDPPAPGGVGDLLSDPGKWLTSAFNALLVDVGRNTTNQAVGFMGWLLNNGNIINQTPPGLSYNSQVVKDLSGILRKIANGALAAVTALGGINLITSPQVRAPYHGVLELVPRVLLGALLVNTSLDWTRFVIDVNNALCQTLGSSSIPAWSAASQPSAGAVLMNLIAITIYLVMGLLLFVQMLMRLALVDALIILAPVALLCWVLPQTYGWARLWFSTFFAAVFVQFVQVLVLQLGANLIDNLPSVLPSAGGESGNDGRVWLVTLLLGVATLQLARQIPRFMPWYPIGGPAFNRRTSNNTRESHSSSSASSSRAQTPRRSSGGR